MKNLFFFLMLILLVSLSSQVVLDPRYHTNEEIYEELLLFESTYPELAKLEQIGTTFTDEQPIWAMKISDNVQVDEDEPAVLYAGQCHAEEVLGVEITMWMIEDILIHYMQPPYNIWIQNIEIWFVPTYNPEGLQVVMDGWDTSFRKNKRDNNENGIFDLIEGPGNDIDGVDLNRNYGFNWIHGDSLYSTNGEELYDYYRGPAPFSEGGTQAIRDLAEEQHFIYSINWHSSRTGNFSEKVFWSFEWDGEKQSPDFSLNESIAINVAQRIIREDGTDSYEPSPSRGRKGSAHDWFYQQHGTTQLLIECGTSNLQPNADLVDDTCERCSEGAYWLLNRTLGYQADAGMLTGIITDENTGEPLVAEVIIQEKHASFFEPRLTDELYGRYWRPLLPNSYTVIVRKKGYEEKVIENVTVNNSLWTNLNISLTPLPEISVSGTVQYNNQPIDGTIIIEGNFPDTIQVSDGVFEFTGYEENLSFWVTADGMVPQHWSEMISPSNHEFNINMQTSEFLIHDSFENSFGNWITSGVWVIDTESYQGNYSARNSEGCFYENDEYSTLKWNQIISLDGVSQDVCLTFWHQYQIEHDDDIAEIQVSLDGNDWTTIASFTGKYDTWHQEFVSLSNYIEQSIYLKFVFTSDSTIKDPGWWIDNIQIIATDANSVDNPEVPTFVDHLYGNYPNPFNPVTTISYSLSQESIVNVLVFNVKGQCVKELISEKKEPGKYEITWDGKDNENSNISSGVFFYKLEINGKTKDVKKCLLLK